MKAVILAAGKGIRMGELTKDTPKGLLEVGGKSILEHDLKALPEEVDEVILVVGHLGEKIREKFGNEFRKPLTFNSSPLKRGEEGSGVEGRKRVIRISYAQQKELKGTAHALWACKDLLSDKFLVLMGDDLYDKNDLEELVKSDFAVLVWELKEDELGTDRQAIIKMDNENNLIDIIERQPATTGSLVNAGAYVLNTDIFKYEMALAGKPATEFGLPQTFLQMAKDGAKFKVIKASKWKKIVSPEDLDSSAAADGNEGKSV